MLRCDSLTHTRRATRASRELGLPSAADGFAVLARLRRAALPPTGRPSHDPVADPTRLRTRTPCRGAVYTFRVEEIMTNPKDNLEPLTPSEGLELYREDRREELSASTLQSHGYRINHFITWCNENDITNLNDVGGRDVQRFKLWRSAQVNTVTLKSQMDTLRVFLRFCQNIDACVDGLAESVRSPRLEHVTVTEKDIIRSNRAEDILSYLSKYRYASIQHLLIRLLWETGARVGALRTLDLDDVHLREQYLEFHHRPETGTPLKNKKKGERYVSISTTTCTILHDYLDEHRHDVTDDGREPLFSTKHGRASINTLRTYAYRMTRPCEYNGGECPHDRDRDSCDAVRYRMSASKCPSSTGTHAFRRGAITDFLNADTPAEVVSDRMDVSQRVIEDHYDSRSAREKMELRRKYLDNI